MSHWQKLSKLFLYHVVETSSLDVCYNSAAQCLYQGAAAVVCKYAAERARAEVARKCNGR